MNSIARTAGCLGILLISLAGGRAAAGENIPATPKAGVEIGMPDSLFQGVPEFLKKHGSGPFLQLMKGSTGIQGNVKFVPDAMTLADQMDQGKIHLGVFLGHEFAFVKSKYPKLTPIAVAAPMQPSQAFCVVRWDCKAENIGDLKGQKISLPPIHKDYSEMFLKKLKKEYLKDATFAGQLNATQGTDAIQDVIDGKSGCTIVDCTILKYFESVNPGLFQNIKILCKSEVFPNACVAVKTGELDEETIEKFRKALLTARDLPRGRPMLTSWSLTGFVKVPDDYEKQLKNIREAYPAPVAAVEK